MTFKPIEITWEMPDRNDTTDTCFTPADLDYLEDRCLDMIEEVDP